MSLDVLVLGAHPDDAEVHVGGLLARCADKGLKAAILDLTSGDLGTRGTPETRHREAMEAARILGVERHILAFPDGRFTEDETYRLKLMVQLRRLRPEVLILPGPEDRHPDHRRAHRLGREAAYYAGLKNYPCVGEPWRPKAVAWAGGENPGAPDLVFDVSAQWERRMRAFDAFGSQFTEDPSKPPTRIAHPAFRRGVEGRAMHWASILMCDWAEALWCDKPVPAALLDLAARLR
ncbi:MAG TPA: bacillithiol biosynthesis deacetylase BshB1 [Holophagaceae bacterium]|jgi:bacillithiol biosynthesis deacetylase BshB1|nr:bacillithiol biosynthesis deacetylase BshB1 [Holophagaceae bacterium]